MSKSRRPPAAAILSPDQLARATVRETRVDGAVAIMPKPRSKYGNVRTEYAGVMYDSKAEAARARELDMLRLAGEIRWWLPKPGSFRLGCPENVYRPDFLVVGNDGRVWVEDTKGRETPKFKRDRRLWAAYGPCDLVLIRGGKREVIEGRRGEDV